MLKTLTSQQIIEFLLALEKPKLNLKDVFTMNPYDLDETKKLVSQFYSKYYSDRNKRFAFIGINPGRLGSGLTGIGFTDPVNLETVCGINNSFNKKHELSSRFVYDVIAAFGGAQSFYKHVYITSAVPLGFTKNGINLNYYDEKELEDALLPYIKQSFEAQLPFLNREVAFCIGKGKNQKFLTKLNKQEGYFKKLEVLPHPRWVMQYRLKKKQEFIDQFVDTIGSYC